MKIEVGAKELKDKLTKVGYAINRRATLPIMSGVKIEAIPSGITFYATDLEKAVKIGVDGEVIAEGKAVVEHKMLKEATKLYIKEKLGDNTPEIKQFRAKCSQYLSSLKETK